MQDISNLKIVVVFHSYGTGINIALRDFLSNRCKKLVFIDHPFSYCKNTVSSMTVYEKGALVNKIRGPKIKGPDILFYIKDVLTTIYFVFGLKERFDLYLGFDNLNAFTGLVLRLLGKVRKVVFYTIDYVRLRFENSLLNRFYHFIDKICCYHADCLWDISERMVQARSEDGVLKERIIPRLVVVPDGSDFDQARRLPFEEINRFGVVFMGHLREGKGIEFIIDALPNICKQVPLAKLMIIGTGPLETGLKQRTKELGIDNKVDFKGFIEDSTGINNLMMYCSVGLAPYEPTPHSFAYYGDPGKIKAYLAVGLPVVVTKVPAFAYEVARAKAGIAVEYNQKEFSEAVVKLLTDDEFYLSCRRNAIELASRYSWENIFTQAFNDTTLILDGAKNG